MKPTARSPKSPRNAEAALSSRRKILQHVTVAGGLGGLGLIMGSGPASAAKPDGQLGQVENVTALRGLKAPRTGRGSVELLGYDRPRDGGGGVFRWEAGSLAADDGGLVIRPMGAVGSLTGRWHRVNVDGAVVDVRWFGVTSGHASCAERLQRAADSAALEKGGVLIVPAGTYVLENTVKLGMGTHMKGVGKASVLMTAPGFAGPMLTHKAASGDLDLSVSGIAFRLSGIHGAHTSCIALEGAGWAKDKRVGRIGIEHCSFSVDAAPVLSSVAAYAVTFHNVDTAWITRNQVAGLRIKSGRANEVVISHNDETQSSVA